MPDYYNPYEEISQGVTPQVPQIPTPEIPFGIPPGMFIRPGCRAEFQRGFRLGFAQGFRQGFRQGFIEGQRQCFGPFPFSR